ncbi:MAG: FecR domain-containing protein [Bacteroidota bacterium]
MPINSRNIDSKLLHYLQSEGSAKEAMSEVEHWIARTDENRAYFEQVKKLWEEKRFVKEMKGIDVDKNWARFREKIEEKQSASVHLPVFQPNRLMLSRIAAVALILVLSAVTLLLVKIRPGNPIQQVSAVRENTELLLSDGSMIELNRGSILCYPEHMNRRRREVTLYGEAFFDIATLNNVPFYVYTGNSTVQVLGTSFNIKEEKEKITLNVISGEVLFFESGSRDHAIRLKPGQKAVYNTTTGRFEQDTFKSENFLFWKTATLTYSAEPLARVFRELEQHFNTPIEIVDRDILQDSVTTSCEGQQLQEILNELSFLHDIYYSTRSDTIFVYKKDQ